MPGEVVFPEILETERLVLRRYGKPDAPAILDLVEKNRPHLIQSFAPMAKGVSEISAAESFVRGKAKQWDARRAFCYGIWRQDSQALIGQLQLKNIAWDIPSAELSYFIDSASQRQGFASEAISVVLRVAFTQLDFKRIFLRIIPSNQRSLLLAKKLGFVHEGLHRSEFRCGYGDLHDVHYFSLTPGDVGKGPVNS